MDREDGDKGLLLQSAQAMSSRKAAGKGPAVGVALAAKTLRAITAVVVFGLPLAVGVVTVAGYGLYRAYKHLGDG